MTHRFHPLLPDDPEDAILFDNCDDCLRHTTSLGLSLDNDYWQRMWDRMMAVEFGGEYYRTDTEAQLGSRLYNLYVLKERGRI